MSYVKDVHQGTYAAEIRTTGTMYGNTITICKDEAKQRGMLFIGIIHIMMRMRLSIMVVLLYHVRPN